MWLVDLKLEQKHGGNDQFDIVKQINPQQMQKKVTKHKVICICFIYRYICVSLAEFSL